MNQFGIAARVALIVVVALFVSQLAAVLSAAWQQGRSPFPPNVIADRVATVVRLIETVPAGERDTALSVANVTGFEVVVQTTEPERFQDVVSFGRIRQLVQAQLDDYSPGYTVRAGAIASSLPAEAGITYMVLVGLRSGETAVFSVSDERTLRIMNLPVGFFAAFLGIIVALLAVLAVRRETRPIVQLAQSVDEVGNRIQPVPVKERGARELRTLIRAINNMQGRILGLVNNRTVFLGAISHDLKTYLTRFRLRLELMPENRHRDKAIHDVEEMERILQDVLSFAQETAASPEPEILDFMETVRHCVSEANLPDRRITLVERDIPRLQVSMPHSALCRVVDNLLTNALRYGNTARVSVAERRETAVLVVEDDGPGIPEKALEEVFEPFVTVDPSRNRESGGTGLGLSIVRQILEVHGGTIKLANRKDAAGLRATVTVPLALRG